MHAQGGAAAGEAVGRAGQGRGEGDAVEEEQGQGLEGGGGGEESWHSRVKGVVNEVVTIRVSECSNITIFLLQEQSHKLDHHYRSQETEYVYFSKLYFAKCTGLRIF